MPDEQGRTLGFATLDRVDADQSELTALSLGADPRRACRDFRLRPKNPEPAVTLSGGPRCFIPCCVSGLRGSDHGEMAAISRAAFTFKLLQETWMLVEAMSGNLHAGLCRALSRESC